MRRITILLSDELHDQLRREAFQAKISMAELIRTRLRGSVNRQTSKPSKDPILKAAGVCVGPVLSRGIDEALYGRRTLLAKDRDPHS
jgi:hypothetical protein